MYHTMQVVIDQIRRGRYVDNMCYLRYHGTVINNRPLRVHDFLRHAFGDKGVSKKVHRVVQFGTVVMSVLLKVLPYILVHNKMYRPYDARASDRLSRVTTDSCAASSVLEP